MGRCRDVTGPIVTPSFSGAGIGRGSRRGSGCQGRSAEGFRELRAGALRLGPCSGPPAPRPLPPSSDADFDLPRSGLGVLGLAQTDARGPLEAPRQSVDRRGCRTVRTSCQETRTQGPGDGAPSPARLRTHRGPRPRLLPALAAGSPGAPPASSSFPRWSPCRSLAFDVPARQPLKVRLCLQSVTRAASRSRRTRGGGPLEFPGPQCGRETRPLGPKGSAHRSVILKMGSEDTCPLNPVHAGPTETVL